MNTREIVQTIEELADQGCHTPTEGRFFITSTPKPYPSTGYCPTCQKAVVIEINVQKGEITCAGGISVIIEEVCFECRHTLRIQTNYIDL